MKPFRERNPVPIGLIGIGVIVALLFAAFNAAALPFIGGGNVYAAAFRDAGGLKSGDEVRIAGVRVGKVEGMDLDGDHVRVDFRVDPGTEFGTESGASIRIKTVVGQKYLSLEPAGPGQLDPEVEIPLDRTASPFDVVEAFTGLAETTGEIDTGQLADSFTVLADAFRDTPENVTASLEGLSRLSTTIASRDAQIRELFSRSRSVSGVLAERNEEFSKLIRDGDLLLQEVERRRQVISDLLDNTTRVSQQLTGLVRDNRAELGPALERLRSVVQTLQNNQANIQESVKQLAAYVRLFSNTIGTGRWFDTQIVNLEGGFIPVPRTTPEIQIGGTS